MPRNVLVITLGGAPGVVTETIWWLMNRREPKWVPDAVHLVTTTLGAKDWSRADTEARRQLDVLMGTETHRKLVPEINVPEDRSGAMIADIRTEAENIAFATHLTRLIKRLSDDPETRLHVSMAGGRKTMSSYAHQAMTLCGRPGDELTHILVDPIELEYNRHFFWPGQEFQEIDIGRPGVSKIILARDANISMVPSPFVKLRGHLKRIPLAQRDFDHWTLVDRIQDSVDQYLIALKEKERTLIVGKERVRFEPQEYALFRVLVQALVQAWPGNGPKGAGDNHRGWIAVPDLRNDSAALKAFFDHYRSCFEGAEDAHFEAFQNDVQAAINSRTAQGLDYVANRFKDIRRKIKERIEAELMTQAAQTRVLPQIKYQRANGGRKHYWRLGLPFEAHKIEII